MCVTELSLVVVFCIGTRVSSEQAPRREPSHLLTLAHNTFVNKLQQDSQSKCIAVLSRLKYSLFEIRVASCEQALYTGDIVNSQPRTVREGRRESEGALPLRESDAVCSQAMCQPNISCVVI